MQSQEIPVVAGPTPPHRRARFPFAVIGLIILALAIPPVWDWLDTDQGPPMPLKMVCSAIVVVCCVLLLVWFALSSRVRRRTKLGVLAGLVFLVLGLFGAIDQLEFTGSWRPIPRYRWEPKPIALLEQHRQAQTEAGDLSPIDLTIDPLRDFPRYRGSQSDGVVRGLALEPDWQAHPPRQLWRQPAGGGYAGLVVAGNVAVTIEQRRDQEVVVCYDRANGRERWAHAYPALFHRSEPMGGEGPRATPAIAGGEVYSLGATGRLLCLDGATGQVRWSVDILKDNRAKNIDWGMTGSPLVVDDLVVVNPGIDPEQNAGHALAAYDRKTGRRVWANGNRPAAYSSPQLAVLSGRRQILLFDAAGLAGFDPKTGRELWDYPWKTVMDMNMTQPLVIGADRVLISSELDNGAALLRLRRDGESYTVEPVWKSRYLASKFSNPVAANGHIYGLSYGILTCLDAETGKRLWKEGRFGHGQVLLVGDVLIVCGEMGEVALVLADPNGYRELARLRVFHGKCWNTPALAGNQLFLRNHREMACFELPLRK